MFRIDPFRRAIAVTPSDVTVLQKTRALYVGGTGNIAVRIGGDTILLSGVPAGATLDLEVDQVHSTNTTATLIVALY